MISAQTAARFIDLPLIEPEQSINIEIMVSLKSLCFSSLKLNGLFESVIILVSLDVSKTPSSRSNFQDLFCFASNKR